MTEQGQTTLVIIGTKKQDLPPAIQQSRENLFWSPDKLHTMRGIPSGIERAVTTEQMPVAVRNALQNVPKDAATIVQVVKDVRALAEYLGSRTDLVSTASPIILIIPDRSVLSPELEKVLANFADRIAMRTKAEAMQFVGNPTTTTAVILFRVDDRELKARLAVWMIDRKSVV